MGARLLPRAARLAAGKQGVALWCRRSSRAGRCNQAQQGAWGASRVSRAANGHAPEANLNYQHRPTAGFIESTETQNRLDSMTLTRPHPAEGTLPVGDLGIAVIVAVLFSSVLCIIEVRHSSENASLLNCVTCSLFLYMLVVLIGNTGTTLLVAASVPDDLLASDPAPSARLPRCLQPIVLAIPR